MLGGQWARLSALAAEVAQSSPDLQPLTGTECNAAAAVARDWTASEALLRAVCTGGPSFEAGVLNVAGVTVRDLQAAIALGDARVQEIASSFPTAPPSPMDTLTRVAKLLVSLRTCIKHDDWASAGDHITVCMRLVL